MKQKILLHVLLLLLSLFLLTACTNNIPPEKACTTDADCVANICCHPDDAVNKDYGPNCGGILCTQECLPNTIDCNQGSIKCAAGMCTAILSP